jgi:hypothetical protein
VEGTLRLREASKMSEDRDNIFGSRESHGKSRGSQRRGRGKNGPGRDSEASSRESQEHGRGSERLGYTPQHCRGSHPQDCEEISRLYVAGEMAGEEASSFEAHFAECDECREMVGEWKRLFSVLSGGVRFEPSTQFDVPVMAFVDRLVGGRQRQRVANRRFAWAAGLSFAAIMIVVAASMKSTLVLPSETARYFAMGTTWIVDAFGRGVEWFIFYLTNSLKLGEILIGVSQTMDPIWHSLRLAAGHVDTRLVVLEILLFMLSLFLLRGLVGTAHKGRCTHVGIIA